MLQHHAFMQKGYNAILYSPIITQFTETIADDAERHEARVASRTQQKATNHATKNALKRRLSNI
jgi:hypothetical protein